MQSMGAGEGKMLGEVEGNGRGAGKLKFVSGGGACSKKPKDVHAAAQPEPQETTTRMGIDVVGDVSWGTHWCLFYQSKQDLIEILVPYFKAGLENNEFCMWITCEPLSTQEAGRALKQAVRNLDDYLGRGQIEILDYSQWYTKSGTFDADAVLQGWVEKRDSAEEEGFEGFRIGGDVSWLEPKNWKEFAQYEQAADGVIAGSLMLVACAYFLNRCGAAEILDVVSNHDFALVKREGKWDIVEKSSRRKDAEEALRQSEEKFRLAMETTRDALWDWNIRTNEVHRNERHATMLGYEPHELSPSQDAWETLIHPEDRPLVHRLTKEHLAGKSGSVEIEYRLRAKSGEYVWVLGRGKLVERGEDGTPLRMVGTSIDITERKKAVEALRESELKYRTLVEQSVMGVAIAQGNPPRLVFANPAMAEITGYSIEELMSISPEGFADLIHPEDRATFFERFGDRLAGKELSPNWLFRAIRKDREIRWLQLACRRITYGDQLAVQASLVDVTDRIVAERALAESEERFRDIFENSVVGLYRTTPDGRIVMANRAIMTMLGYTSFDELKRRNLEQEGFEPEYPRTEFKKRIEADEQVIGLESRWIRSDGTVLFVRESARAIRDEQGRVLYYEGTVEDITERKEALDRLSGALAWQEAMFEGARDAVLITDADSKFVMVNRRACELTGYSKQELLGMRIPDLHEPQDLTAYNLYHDRIMSGEEIVSEAKLLRKDGTKIDTEFGNTRVSISGRMYMHTIARDITDRKRAEGALQESEHRLALAIECAGLGLWDQDFETGRINRNENWAKMLGYDPDEIGCDRESYRRLLHPDDVPDFERCAKDHEAGLTDTFDIEHRMRSKSGQWRWIQNFGRVVDRDDQGRPLRALGVHLDITERKKAEQVIKSRARLNRILLDAMPNLAMLVRPYSREVVACNERAAKAGVAPGKRCYEAWGGRDTPCTQCRAPQVWETGRPQQAEMEQAGLVWDAHWVPVSENLYMYYAYDITERKKAENKLRESEERYRQLVSTTTDAIMLFDAETQQFIDVNKASEELYGYSIQEFLELKLCDISIEPDKSAESIRQTIDRETERIPLRYHRKKDGTIFPVEITYSSFVLGERRVLCKVIRDITERRRAENELERERSYLESLHNALGDAVFSVEMPDRIVKSVNAAVESVLGYTPKECEGKKTEVFYPNKRAYLEFGERLKRGIEQGQDVIKTEQILKCKNGDIFFSDITTSFLRENGQITEIISIIRDITERKIAEARLTENRMKLKAMASRILRAEDRERQRIALGLHDDICQKLVLTKLALESSLGLIAQKEASKLVATACGAIGEAIEEADSLTFALSNPVLRELGFEVALEKYLREEIRQKHKIKYEFEGDGQSGDLPDEIKTCLFRVTRELLTNVVKHAGAQTVRAAVRKCEGSICVTIEDDGVGFEVARAGCESTGTSRFGLFSIREQLEHLGGRLEIESRPGAGAKATVFLPLGKESDV